MTGQNLFRKRASLDSKDAQRPRRSRCLRTSEVLRLQQTMMFSRTVVDHDPRVPADAVTVFDTPVPWRVPGGDLHVPVQQIVANIYVSR